MCYVSTGFLEFFQDSMPNDILNRIVIKVDFLNNLLKYCAALMEINVIVVHILNK